MPANAALDPAPIVPIGLAAEPHQATPEVVHPDHPSPEDSKTIQLFSARKPSLLTAGELRRMRFRYEEFARSLATRLSIHLRMEIGFEVAELDTCFFSDFVQLLPSPTQIIMFNVEGLAGAGLIEVPRSLAIGFVERLLGGAGKPTILERELTEIETALLDQIIEILLKEWCQTVAGFASPKVGIVGHESNPRYLQTAQNDSSFLLLTLEMTLDGAREKLHLGFPFSMLQPIIDQLSPGAEPRKQPVKPQPPPVEWNPELSSIKVPLTVAWETVEIDARKLANLKVGDVLPVESSRAEHTSVQLASVPKFTGRLGKCGNTWAIELVSRI